MKHINQYLGLRKIRLIKLIILLVVLHQDLDASILLNEFLETDIHTFATSLLIGGGGQQSTALLKSNYKGVQLGLLLKITPMEILTGGYEIGYSFQIFKKLSSHLKIMFSDLKGIKPLESFVDFYFVYSESKQMVITGTAKSGVVLISGGVLIERRAYESWGHDERTIFNERNVSPVFELSSLPIQLLATFEYSMRIKYGYKILNLFWDNDSNTESVYIFGNTLKYKNFFEYVFNYSLIYNVYENDASFNFLRNYTSLSVQKKFH